MPREGHRLSEFSVQTWGNFSWL